MRSITVLTLCVAMICHAQEGPKPQAQPAAAPLSPAATAQPAPPPLPASIKLIAIQGEGALNSVKTRKGTQIVVEVRDDKDKPVPGAEVVFQLPAEGPGGTFNDWMRSQTARTNEQGQAGTSALAPNDQEGRFNVKVTATLSNGRDVRTANLVVGQSNGNNGGAQAKSSKKGLWITLAVIGAAAIAGGAAKAASGDSTSTTTTSVPVTVSAGPITVGGPR